MNLLFKNLIRKLSSGKEHQDDMTPIKHVFFCSTHRSGSTAFVESIKKSNVCGIPEEAFYPPARASLIRKYDCPPNTEFIEWLKLCKIEATTENHVFSTKLFPDNMDWLLEQISLNFDLKSDEELWDKFQDLFPNAYFIHLERRDKLQQAISLLKAIQTNVWHSTQKPQNPDVIPYYSYTMIKGLVTNNIKQAERWDSFFDRFKISPLNLFYEDFSDDMEKYALSCLKYCKIGNGSKTVAQKTFSKLRDKTSREWLERFKHEEDIINSRSEVRILDHSNALVDITVQANPDTLLPNYPYPLKVFITNKSEEEWHCLGGPEGQGRIQLVATIKQKDSQNISEEKVITLPRKLNPSETYETRLHFVTPDSSGELEVKFEVVQLNGPTFHGLNPILKTFLVSNIYKDTYQKYIGEYNEMPDHWVTSSWFGYCFWKKFPWIYHQEHGWIQLIEEESKNEKLVFSDFTFGKWSIFKGNYADVYSTDRNRDYKFLKTEYNLRHFLDKKTNEIVYYKKSESTDP